MERTESQVLGKNALARRLYAERSLRENGYSSPQKLINAHEAWLKAELIKFGAPVDDMTWNAFSNHKIDREKARQIPYSFRTLRWRTFNSIGNILQILAWYHAPEQASWGSPTISFRPTSQVFVNHEGVMEVVNRRAQADKERRWPPMERYKSYLRGHAGIGHSDKAPLKFEVNEHYEGMRGSLRHNRLYKFGRLPTDVDCKFDPETDILQVSFTNPNDFLGWYENPKTGKPEYELTLLNRLLAKLSQAIRIGDKHFIAVDTWDSSRKHPPFGELIK